MPWEFKMGHLADVSATRVHPQSTKIVAHRSATEFFCRHRFSRRNLQRTQHRTENCKRRKFRIGSEVTCRTRQKIVFSNFYSLFSLRKNFFYFTPPGAIHFQVKSNFKIRGKRISVWRCSYAVVDYAARSAR